VKDCDGASVAIEVGWASEDARGFGDGGAADVAIVGGDV
jgi:hypothetical protein